MVLNGLFGPRTATSAPIVKADPVDFHILNHVKPAGLEEQVAEWENKCLVAHSHNDFLDAFVALETAKPVFQKWKLLNREFEVAKNKHLTSNSHTAEAWQAVLRIEQNLKQVELSWKEVEGKLQAVFPVGILFLVHQHLEEGKVKAIRPYFARSERKFTVKEILEVPHIGRSFHCRFEGAERRVILTIAIADPRDFRNRYKEYFENEEHWKERKQYQTGIAHAVDTPKMTWAQKKLPFIGKAPVWTPYQPGPPEPFQLPAFNGVYSQFT